MPPTDDTIAIPESAPAMQIHARFCLLETSRISLFQKNADGQWVPGEGTRVKLSPVQGEPFGSATPGGSLEMVIANPAASAVFLGSPIGQEFDVLFTPRQ